MHGKEMQLDWMEAEWKLLSGCFLRSHFQDIGSKQFLAYKTEWNNTWKRGREKENRRKKERKGIIKWWIEKIDGLKILVFSFFFFRFRQTFLSKWKWPLPPVSGNTCTLQNIQDNAKRGKKKGY